MTNKPLMSPLLGLVGWALALTALPAPLEAREGVEAQEGAPSPETPAEGDPGEDSGEPEDAAVDGEAGEIVPSEVPDLARLRELLTQRYPGRDDVRRSWQDIARILIEYQASHTEAADLSEAAFLLGEIYVVGGRGDTAKSEWRRLSEKAERAADRARALFLLSSEAFVSGDLRGSLLPLQKLRRQYPDQERWQRASERLWGYFEILRKKKLPDFRAQFRAGDKTRKISEQSLRGKVTLLYFWRSTSPKHDQLEEKLSRSPVHSVPAILDANPILRKRVEVLGVNLDKDSRRFERALALWRIVWPQLHTGEGFETPLVKRLGVPRCPAWMVIGPDLDIAYYGFEVDQFYAHGSAQLESLRASLEKKKRK